jgi:hypothetical protein
MRSAVRNLRLGGLAAATLAFFVTGGTCRAEVGSFWASGASLPTISGYEMVQIGDDPDPVPPTIWHLFTPSGPGRVALNPAGEANGDGPPSILTDPGTGLLVVAWARNSASGFDVVTSRFESGIWSVPQVVVDVAANALDPQLVRDTSGNVHMFYWVDGVTPQVFHVQAPADLSSWSSPLLVSQPGQAACRPAGTVFQDLLRVAYEVHDFGYGNSPRQVVLARFEGGAFVPEIVAITNNLADVRPEVHAHAGHMWVDWIDAETTGASGEIAWTRVDTQGHWEPIRYEPFANREQRDYLVRGGVRLKAIQ